MNTSKKVYAVDLDGTLAYYTDWVHHTVIGEPIPAMVEKVRSWLDDGHDVVVFTARMNASTEKLSEIEEAIRMWCINHIGHELPVTGNKLLSFDEIHDDRSISIVKNTGLSQIEHLIQCFANVHKSDSWVTDALATLLHLKSVYHNEGIDDESDQP